jgi:hypothetical protein
MRAKKSAQVAKTITTIDKSHGFTDEERAAMKALVN